MMDINLSKLITFYYYYFAKLIEVKGEKYVCAVGYNELATKSESKIE